MLAKEGLYFASMWKETNEFVGRLAVAVSKCCVQCDLKEAG